jgi:hypothetical protein
MAFITADRVRDTSTTAGSGAFSVSGTAPTGYRTFSAVLSVSDTFYYSIQHQTLNEWEVGLGTYSSANTFARTTIYSSSNAGSAVTFSAGTKDVFITMAAARSPQLNASGNVTALGTPVSATLTNATGLPLTTGVTGILPFANGGSLAWQSVQTSSFAAVAGNAYPVNTTSGAVTVTLPASPTAGQAIQVSDYAGTWQTNNVTISPNGNKINSSTSSFVASAKRGSLALVYIDSTQGWLVYSVVNVSNPAAYSASYLFVAGGAGGGAGGGGGGAGGLVSGTVNLSPGTVYFATVGAGGAKAPQATVTTSIQGFDGNISSLTPVGNLAGGGGGGGSVNTSIAAYNSGRAGGSGGGGAVSATSGTGGSGTSGQGFAGGANAAAAPAYGGGGGGGSSAVGTAGSSSTGGGAGGAGTASSITGASVTYAGGGGGGSYTSGAAGAGGSGGGGAGGAAAVAGTDGTANTGGGGGGGGQTGSAVATTGGNGGSGVVILSVPTANYTGTYSGSPTITTSGSNTIIKFTASGTYTA